MSEAQGFWQPKRLLLEILADADRRAVLAQAAMLARALDAEIAGVFVEEADLFDLADLSLATEIGFITRRLRPIETSSLTAESLRSAAAFRRSLAELAAMLGRDAPMEVLRGRSLDLFRQAGREDLVIYTGSVGRLEEAGCAHALLEAARQTAGLLLTPPRLENLSGPLLLMAQTQTSLELALPALRRLAGEAGLQQEAPPAGSQSMLEAAAILAGQHGARLLVSEAAPAHPGQERELRQALRRLRCPLLLLNPPA